MEFEDLIAYKKADANAMLVFEASKAFPIIEKYSLTDQTRRSSRSVCANIAEAYRKRGYPKHFVSKLTDADGKTRKPPSGLTLHSVVSIFQKNSLMAFMKKHCK